MSKIIYTSEMIKEAIQLRLSGKSIPEIVQLLGIKKPSLQKIFQKENIKLNPEQKKTALARRWLNHQPIKDGFKCCSACDEWKPTENFHKTNYTLTGYVSSCKECYSLFYEKNAEKIKKRATLYRLKNPEKKKESDKKCYLNNKERYILRAKQWCEQNPERRKEIFRNYEKNNQNKKNARGAKYRAIKIQATPRWLNEQQIEEIQRIYINCPPGYHVDHIVPLRGKGVRGLHVPWNLQYLSALDNLKKGNRI